MDFDAAKENIQPLSTGRNASLLQASLRADSIQELHAQRNQLEAAINNYSGDDPLEPWYSYITWIEQSYPSGGKESGLEQVLIKCLEKFEDEKRYYQDRRMVKLYIKFIDSNKDPTECYQQLYNAGIGTMVADLYICWAYYYDLSGNSRKADEIFRRGLDCHAQPFEELQEAHQHFGFTVAQRVMYQDDENAKQDANRQLQERRLALTSLRGQRRKAVVGSVRTGSVVKSHTPGTVQSDVTKSRRNERVPVFSDENFNPNVEEPPQETDSAAVQPDDGKAVIRSIIDKARHQENEREPGPWNKAGEKKGKLFAKSQKAHTPAFNIHEDKEDNSDNDDVMMELEILPELPVLIKADKHELNFYKPFKFPTNFKCKNRPLPQWHTPVTIENEPTPRCLPRYNKCMLYPRPNKEFQLEEYSCYKILKKRGISNKFTQDRDVYWSKYDINANVRQYPNFAKHSLPQKLDSMDAVYVPEKKKGLIVNFDEIYQTEEGTEFQFEELLAIKFKKGLNVTNVDIADMDETTVERGNRRRSFFPMRKSIATGRKSILPTEDEELVTNTEAIPKEKASVLNMLRMRKEQTEEKPQHALSQEQHNFASHISKEKEEPKQKLGFLKSTSVDDVKIKEEPVINNITKENQKTGKLDFFKSSRKYNSFEVEDHDNIEEKKSYKTVEKAATLGSETQLQHSTKIKKEKPNLLKNVGKQLAFEKFMNVQEQEDKINLSNIPSIEIKDDGHSLKHAELKKRKILFVEEAHHAEVKERLKSKHVSFESKLEEIQKPSFIKHNSKQNNDQEYLTDTDMTAAAEHKRILKQGNSDENLEAVQGNLKIIAKVPAVVEDAAQVQKPIEIQKKPTTSELPFEIYQDSLLTCDTEEKLEKVIAKPKQNFAIYKDEGEVEAHSKFKIPTIPTKTSPTDAAAPTPFFDAGDDETCSTQTFNIFLKSKPMSTPKINKVVSRQFGTVLKELPEVIDDFERPKIATIKRSDMKENIVMDAELENVADCNDIEMSEVPAATVLYSPVQPKQLSTILETSEQGTTHGTTHTTTSTNTKSTISSPEFDVEVGTMLPTPAAIKPVRTTTLETLEEHSVETSLATATNINVEDPLKNMKLKEPTVLQTPSNARLIGKTIAVPTEHFSILDDTTETYEPKRAGEFSRLIQVEDNTIALRSLRFPSDQTSNTETISKFLCAAQNAKFQEDKTETISKILLPAATANAVSALTLNTVGISEKQKMENSKIVSPVKMVYDSVKIDDSFDFFAHTPPTAANKFNEDKTKKPKCCESALASTHQYSSPLASTAKRLCNAPTPVMSSLRLMSTQHENAVLQKQAPATTNKRNVALFEDEVEMLQVAPASATAKPKLGMRDSFIPDFSYIEDTQPVAVVEMPPPINDLSIIADSQPHHASNSLSKFKYNASSFVKPQSKLQVNDNSMVEPSQQCSTSTTATKWQQNASKSNLQNKNAGQAITENSKSSPTAQHSLFIDSFINDFSGIKNPLRNTADQKEFNNSTLRFLNDSIMQNKSLAMSRMEESATELKLRMSKFLQNSPPSKINLKFKDTTTEQESENQHKTSAMNKMEESATKLQLRMSKFLENSPPSKINLKFKDTTTEQECENQHKTSAMNKTEESETALKLRLPKPADTSSSKNIKFKNTITKQESETTNSSRVLDFLSTSPAANRPKTVLKCKDTIIKKEVETENTSSTSIQNVHQADIQSILSDSNTSNSKGAIPKIFCKPKEQQSIILNTSVIPLVDEMDQEFELNCATEMFATNISMIKNSTWLPARFKQQEKQKESFALQQSQIQEASLHIKEEPLSGNEASPKLFKSPPLPSTQNQESSNKIFLSKKSEGTVSMMETESPENNNDDNNDNENSIYYKHTPKTPKFSKHKWDDVEIIDSEPSETENIYKHQSFDLNQTQQTIENLCIDPKVNPFCSDLITAFLEQIEFVDYIDKLPNCKLIGFVPRLHATSTFKINKCEFQVSKMVGEGAYGSVYLGINRTENKKVAMKQEKPPNYWEYYICLEIQSRLQGEDMFAAYMSVDYAQIGNNGSVLISAFSEYGSLIEVCNKIKRKTLKNVDEYVVMLLACELLDIVDHLHAIHIIHADFKPDNILLMKSLSYPYDGHTMQLIDFGVSIDMQLFKPKQVFTYINNDNQFKCIEMRERNPWTYQLDLYGLASCIHVLLFGKYMDVEKTSNGTWMHRTYVPRYINKSLWERIFKTLLNIRDCYSMPNLQQLRAELKAELSDNEKFVIKKVTEFNQALRS